MSTPRQHAYTGPALPIVPEPTHAERTRTLLHLHSVATLSTISKKQAGFPFGSLMPYALDAFGRPMFLISNMAMHTQNIKADARASLFVTQPATDGDPLGAARATLVGNVLQVGEEGQAAVRAEYLAQHPKSSYWVDFVDFSFFRMEIVDVYYVGGFGVMGWVTAEDYSQARPDPLSAHARGILEHMNADHVDSMIQLARIHSQFEASEAAMTSVDRLGFHLRLKTADGMKGTRINFPNEVSTPGETRMALVAMVQASRKQG
jgi:putative heme iron utilization protein